LPAPAKPAPATLAPARQNSAKPAPAHRAKLVAECHDLAHEVSAAMSRSAGSDLLSLELTMGQFKAMATLTMLGPQAVGELGRRLDLSEPAASLLVDRLEQCELAVRERDPADRRRTLVRATAAAEELTTRLREGRREHIERLFGGLSADELAGLIGGLRGVLRVTAELAGEAPAGADAPRAEHTDAPRAEHKDASHD
jgi:DNA-binding MarR family transcriptional regulator